MNRIAELRKQHNVSQKELAKELGIAQNTLSQYENEVRNPTTRVVFKISQIFDVSTNYVLGYPEKVPEPSNSSQNISNITKVTKITSPDQVNLLLNLGWKIIHVGTEGYNSDGCFESETVFTLGWYGNPQSASIPQFEPDGEEYWTLY